MTTQEFLSYMNSGKEVTAVSDNTLFLSYSVSDSFFEVKNYINCE